MDENVVHHQLILPENFIVHSVENIPVSVIDYDKIEVTQLIHSGQFPNGTPVLQLADVNSNLHLKELHPLELEIQRDLETKQQQELALSKEPTNLVIHAATQTIEEQCQSNSPKPLEIPGVVFDGVVQFQSVPNIREDIVDSDVTKLQENVLYQPENKQILLDKGQFYIVPENQILFNDVSRDNEAHANDVPQQEEESIEPIHQTEETVPPVPPVEELSNHGSHKLKKKEKPTQSDSECDEEDVEPVNDYEPDPDPDNPPSLDASQTENSNTNKCYVCFKSFRQKKNMYAHIRKIHSIQPKIEGGILCPLCKMHALRQEHLRNHLETLHSIQIEKEEKLFDTLDDFLTWKKHIEKETLSLFVSKSSSKLLANNQQKTYYKCHRSGYYVTLSKNRKKRLKDQGSNKMGATCPAAMEVVENSKGIYVIFWKTHVGHSHELAHLSLTKDDKAQIMDHLNYGRPFDEILEHFKTEGLKNPPSKLNVLTKQDLRNVRKELETTLESKKKLEGRKPIKERMLRRASQELIIEKADILLKLLETTEITPEFRPKICLMLDNLISTVKRRASKVNKRGIYSERRKHWVKRNRSDIMGYKDPKNKMKKKKCYN